ncbi:hypothetical protein [Methanobrevibacter sp.]|uniref:hypothetical protein n=1 Tax=Methanobrevibacter sp. TaxID=66852 RepID=UPI003865704B
MDRENFENFLDNYNIEDDIIYQDFMRLKEDKTESTKTSYKKTLNDLCNANVMPLYEIYKNCKEEQRDRVVDGAIIPFSPNDIDTHTKKYFNNFLNYIEINKAPYETEREKNRGKTINLKVALLKSFFEKYDLKLPDYEKKNEDDSKDWKPLSKKDIEYIVNDSTLEQTALWSFMMSTGMRESDCVNLKIRDFMEATAKMGYHNYVDVNDFIDNAPQDMIGFWDFMPQKTIKDRIKCMTFNNRESSNYILQSLRKIKNDYLPKHNKKHDKNLKISKDAALFGSRTYNYLGHRKPNSITQAANKKNKKLREHYITQIEDKISNGEIGEEDREKYIEDIPVFHGHQLRRYFITTIRRHATNLSHSAMMEGHAPPMPNDPSYVNITKEDVEKIYNKAIYELSLFEVDEDAIFDSKSDELRAEWADERSEWAKEKIKLNEQIQKQAELQQQKDAEIAELKAELAKATSSFETMENRLANVESQLPHLQNTNPASIPINSEPIDAAQMIGIKNLIDYHYNNTDNPQWIDMKIQELKGSERVALMDITYNLIKEEHKNPELFEEFEPLIIKALFKMEDEPTLVQESFRYHNERSFNMTKILRYTDLLYDLLAENYLTEEERLAWEKHKQWEEEHGAKLLTKEFSESRLAKMADDISRNFYDNVNDYLLEEINEDLVKEDIEKFFQSNVDE